MSYTVLILVIPVLPLYALLLCFYSNPNNKLCMQTVQIMHSTPIELQTYKENGSTEQYMFTITWKIEELKI